MNFRAKCDVARLTDGDEGPVTGFSVDVTINCIDCGMPFHFKGVPFGYSPAQPMLSADGLELRAPIGPGTLLPAPVGEKGN